MRKADHLARGGRADEAITVLRPFAEESTPTAVSGGHTWATISEGYATTCGVTTSGSGYCWGWNNAGQLGNNTTTNEDVPTAVSGSYTWASINAGTYDTCGVTTSGTGYCWGSNGDGELGINSTTEGNTPAAISGGYTWAQISEGYQNTCGLTTAGVGYCWGGNWDGQVGNGNTNTPEETPQAVSGSLTFAGIATGADQTADTNCGLAQDGIIYCWGYNNDSQIGNGNTTNEDIPTEAGLLFASTDNTTVSVTVDPSFTFTVANQSSACNGESNFVSGAGMATTVALGHLAVSSNVSGGQALSVSGNTGNGFVVYVRGTQASQNLRSAGHNWADVSGSYASPAVLGSGERFGYTYHDSTSSSSVTNPASANFAALTNATTNAVMGSTTSETGSACVSYDAQTGASTPAGTYTATVIYTAIPTY